MHCVCACVYGGRGVSCAGAYKGQKRASDGRQLELQVIASLLTQVQSLTQVLWKSIECS